jgi:vacuolar-type H+-ATPase subunit F/Vma7
MEESRMQIIILSPDASEAISDELLQRRMEGRTIPLVVVLPEEGKDKMAQDLIRRAIGMDVEGKEALK